MHFKCCQIIIGNWVFHSCLLSYSFASTPTLSVYNVQLIFATGLVQNDNVSKFMLPVVHMEQWLLCCHPGVYRQDDMHGTKYSA